MPENLFSQPREKKPSAQRKPSATTNQLEYEPKEKQSIFLSGDAFSIIVENVMKIVYTLKVFFLCLWTHFFTPSDVFNYVAKFEIVLAPVEQFEVCEDPILALRLALPISSKQKRPKFQYYLRSLLSSSVTNLEALFSSILIFVGTTSSRRQRSRLQSLRLAWVFLCYSTIL